MRTPAMGCGEVFVLDVFLAMLPLKYTSDPATKTFGILGLHIPPRGVCTLLSIQRESMACGAGLRRAFNACLALYFLFYRWACVIFQQAFKMPTLPARGHHPLRRLFPHHAQPHPIADGLNACPVSPRTDLSPVLWNGGSLHVCHTLRLTT